MKFIKIRFTSWRDHSPVPRTIGFQAQLDALTMCEGALITASASTKAEQEHDSDVLQRSLARINDELLTIEAQRTFLLSGEEATAEDDVRAANAHEKAGTFGYQVLDETVARAAMVVDEAGDYLLATALYTYEVIHGALQSLATILRLRGNRREREALRAVVLSGAMLRKPCPVIWSLAYPSRRSAVLS